AEAALDHTLQPDEGAAADKEHLRRVHADVFLLRMLATTLGRHVANGPFQDFQQRLLHTFAGNVAGNRDVFGFAGDLVDLININNAALSAFDVVIGVLQQAQNDVLDIFADVAGLGKSSGIGDGEGHIEDLGKSAGEQGLAGTRRANHQDIAFLDFDLSVGIYRGAFGTFDLRRG